MPRPHHLAVLAVAAVGLFAASALAAEPPPPPPPPPPQIAVSTNLSWDHCAGDGYVADRTFACDTNTGSDVLVASMVIHDGVTRSGVLQFNAFIDITPTTTTVPSWWMFRNGECRSFALSIDVANLAPTAHCLPWFGAGSPLSVTAFSYFQDRLYLQAAMALPAGAEVTLLPGQEYELFHLVLRHSKSAGTGSCAGCGVPACIGIGQLDLGGLTLIEKFPGVGLNAVTWQGGYVASYPTSVTAPPNYYHSNVLSCTTPPVPAVNRTWGTIKTLYR